MAPQQTPQERIISHMNKDHKISVEDYLVSYGHVDIKQVKSFELQEIDTESISISFKLTGSDLDLTKVIPFDPPMKSLAEARERLVAMAKDAAQQRGLSYFTISEYVAPDIFGMLLIALIHLPVLTFFFPIIVNNEITRNFLDQSFIDWLIKYSLGFELLAFLIHASEVYFILAPLLTYYRMEDFQLEWYIAGFTEGYPAIRRFKNLVEQQTQASKPKKD